MVIYLLQIIISLILWYFNLSHLYNELFLGGNIKVTVYTIFITIGVALVNLIIMRIWGMYNFKRFSHLRRRTFQEDVQTQEIQVYFNLSQEILHNMQNNKIIILEKTIV